MPVANKPLAFMAAADVNAQAPVFRKNISDYPQCSLLETATIAIGKTLGAIRCAPCAQCASVADNATEDNSVEKQKQIALDKNM